MLSSLVCPVCGRTDLIRKVVSVYEEGRASASGWGYGYYTVLSQSALSARLAPPPQPEGAFGPTWVVPLLIGLAFFFLCPIMALLLLFSSALQNAVKSSESMGVTVVLIVLALFLMAVIVGAILLGRAIGGGERAAGARQARYQQAVNIWHLMYYCFRDDVVFLPGQWAPVSPEMRATLW